MQEPMHADISGASPAELAPVLPPSSTWAGFASPRWWQQLEKASRSILMLDFDGTLAPFVRDRMAARPYPGVCDRLERLAAAPRLRLVLVSGRPAPQLASLLPSHLHLELWGSHGRERIMPDGSYTAMPLLPDQQHCLAQLEAALLEQGLESVMEKKVGSLAMHTRGLPAPETQQIEALARRFSCMLPANAPDPGMEWLPFDGGIELRGVGCTKATAVRDILRDEPPGVPSAYLGDDQTDEDAFAALEDGRRSRPVLRVLVRPELRPSAADLWLVPPAELLAFLDRWLTAVSGDSQ